MDISTIISSVVAIGFLLFVGMYAIKYWPFTIFIVGVFLINIFTIWAAVLIFALAFGVQIYEKHSKNELSPELVFNELLPSSFKTTFYIVVVSLVIGFVFSNMGGGSGACTRGTPQFC